jgi:hypothetical protein
MMRNKTTNGNRVGVNIGLDKGYRNPVNIGYSSRLPYDDCAYEDRLFESTGPLKYRLNTDQNFNCNACLPTFGPRSSVMGFGVSLPVKNHPGLSQDKSIIDIESLLSNRNVSKSRCRRNELNPIDVTKFKLINPIICNDFLNPIASRLSYPPATYRDLGVNRFYNLNKNAQVNIYWDTAVNSVLEAKDNFAEEIPGIWSPNPSIPAEYKAALETRDYRVTNYSGPTA